MFIVNQEVKDAFNSKGSIKRGYISVVPLDEEEPIIISEGNIKEINYLDDIYTPSQGIIGSVISKQVDITLFRPENFSLENREFDLFFGVEVNGTPEYVPMGRYIVQKPDNNIVNSKTMSLAFDYMVKFNVKYVDDGIYPKTARNLFESICAQAGVEPSDEPFLNENFIIDNNQFVNGESCRNVLMAIAQLAASKARIGRDNKVYISLVNSNTPENYDKSNYTKDTSINEVYGPVNRLIIRMSQVDGENVTEEDTESIEQNGAKELTISDNPLLYTQEKRESVLESIWSVVNGFTYTSFKAKTKTRPYMDCGDAISLENLDENYYYSYLLTQSIKFNGGFSCDISATAESETETKYLYTPDLFNAVKRTEFKVDKANQQILLLAEQQSQQGTQISQIQINLDNIYSQIQQDIPDLYSKYNIILQEVDKLTIDIGMKNGTNLIRNSAMRSGTDYWLNEPFMHYISSDDPPENPYNYMWWYCTENKNGYERGIFYQWNESTSTWERTNATKEVFGEMGLLENVEHAENTWARQNTISGSMITLNGKSYTDPDMVTHIFALTSPVDVTQTQDYMALSHLFKNNSNTGVIYMGVAFSPIYIEDMRDNTAFSIDTIYEDSLLLTPDDMKDLTKIDRIIKIPKKEDVLNVISSSTAPVDTTQLWLDNSFQIATLKQYVNGEWIIYETTPSLLDQNGSIWVYRAFFYGYYQTLYGIDDFIAKVAYCFFTFYPSFDIALQSTEPTPHKGIYWGDTSVGGTVKRAKYNDTEFVEWEELYFPTQIIIDNPQPTPPYPSQYAMLLSGNYIIADLKLEYGRSSSMWTNHPEEMYGKNFKFDTNGFTIKSAQNQMFIDEDEINATYNGVSVFSIFKNEASFERVKTNTANIAQIEIVNQTINGDSVTIEY